MPNYLQGSPIAVHWREHVIFPAMKRNKIPAPAGLEFRLNGITREADGLALEKRTEQPCSADGSFVNNVDKIKNLKKIVSCDQVACIGMIPSYFYAGR
jgi:hypothetical protein